MDNSTANKILVSFGINEKSYKDVTKKIKDDFKQLKETVNSSTNDFGSAGNALTALQMDIGEIGLAVAEVTTSFYSLKVTLETLSEYKDIFVEWYDDMFGLAAATAAANGDIESSFKAVQEVASQGFLSEQEAATAIKRLISYGYSAEQASDITIALANSATVLRKENMSLGQAVDRATYGIANQQSIMAKASGMTLTLEQIHEAYAQALGKTADELSLAEKRQAEYNAFVGQGLQYQNAASIYAESSAGSTLRLSNAIQNAKAAIGSVFQYLAPIINGLANFVLANKEVVASILTFITMLVGGVGLVVAVSTAIKALKLFSQAIAGTATVSKAAAGGIAGLILVVTALVGALVASNLISKQIGNQFDDLTKNSGSLADSLKGLNLDFDDVGMSAGGTSDAIKNVGRSARDTAKELDRLRRDYLEDLKQIEINHQNTIDNLTKQVHEANIDYRRAIEERNAEFAVSQAKEEKVHQEKVDELMTQIDFLRRYNNDYNKQKLATLEFALEKENNLYKKQTQAAQEELEIQNENDRIAYEEKRAQLQAELDDELAFMNKHRQDLNEVRNVILLDEIDSLKRRYEEQKKSYQEQSIAAGIAGGDIAGGLTGKFNDVYQKYMENLAKQIAEASDELEKNASSLGEDVGGNFWTNFRSKTIDIVSQIVAWVVEKAIELKKAIADAFDYLLSGRFLSDTGNAIGNYFKGIGDRLGMAFDVIKTAINPGFATGGYTGQGAVDEIAGVVHKGEYVLPQEMVDQNTGTPKSLGNTFVININGTFATSAAERRKVADQIVAAINQNNKARLEASWQ